MSADGDIVRAWMRCRFGNAAFYNAYDEALAALVRLEAAVADQYDLEVRLDDEVVAHGNTEAQRDALAEALREIAAYEDDCIHQRQARAALAEAGLE